MHIAIKDNVPTPARPSGIPQASSENSNYNREALAMFEDELSAYHYLEQLLWPNGVCCPGCGSAKVGKLNGASTRLGTFKCYGCRKIFSILHGTLMSGSQVPPHKWLQAMYLTEAGTKPMRPHQVCRILDVSPKTARSMMRRICEAADGLHPTFEQTASRPLRPQALPALIQEGPVGD
jgi:transposase-like protein